MKTTILITAILYQFSWAIAQDQNNGDYRELASQDKEMKSLIGNNASHGGFGALMFGYTQIDDRSAVMAGFRAGWVINHSFSLGFGGHGFFNDLNENNLNNQALTGGYGGLILEPIIFPRSPVHISFPVLVGAGAIASLIEYPDLDNDPWGDYDYVGSDIYFVVEPGINLELSVVNFMRLGLGATYRYAEEISLNNVDKHALNGFSGVLTMKFGKF